MNASYYCVLILGFTHCLIPLQIIPNFFPPLEGQVRQGVFNSLNFIMEKRVLALVYHTHTIITMCSYRHFRQKFHPCDPAGFKMLCYSIMILTLSLAFAVTLHLCLTTLNWTVSCGLCWENASQSSAVPRHRPQKVRAAHHLFIASHVNKQKLKPNSIHQKCYTKRHF